VNQSVVHHGSKKRGKVTIDKKKAQTALDTSKYDAGAGPLKKR
jgi:hypothetical protein